MNTYKKFTDGVWGVVVRSEEAPNIGAQVTVTTRKGKEKREFIAAVRQSIGNEHYCDIIIGGSKPGETKDAEIETHEAETHEANGFDSMTVAELRAACRARGISHSGVSAATKAHLLDTLKAGKFTPLEPGMASLNPRSRNANGEPLEPMPDDVAASLVATIQRIAGGTQQTIPEDRIREIAREESGDLREYVESKLEGIGLPLKVEIKVGELPKVELPRQHWKFPLLLACAAAGVPAYLVGERGSGKTTVGHAVAKALGREFGSMSCGPATSKSDIIGFIGATGSYCMPEGVRMARDGGVYLYDELDSCHPGALVQANSIWANGQFGTPGGVIIKSANYYPIAGGNTHLHGATLGYKGRQALDGATGDRWAIMDWPYDGNLERVASGLLPHPKHEVKFTLSDGGVPTIETWVELIQSVRADAMGKKLITFPSPRASEFGAKLINAGVGYRWLRELLIVRGQENMDAITPKSI